MAKKKITFAKEPVKSELIKVKFIKDFEGQLNDKPFKHLKGAEIEVSKIHFDWLSKHGAIKEC